MIFLALGSNLTSEFGDRFQNINLAINLLNEKNINLVNKSSFYESVSYPNKNDPKFINIVISVQTKLKSQDLMNCLLSIEEKLGRKRLKKNDPRTCDIDIIDFNGKIINLKFNNLDLNIPHKKMVERNFVLYPLKEICPNWSHPQTKDSIDILIKNLKTSNNEITKLNQNDIITHVK
tara:strand:- start:192 stop:722 length:531 start_codon:yes stop_codon:yes gene_type:complete